MDCRERGADRVQYGRRLFAATALGYVSAKSYHECENCDHRHTRATTAGLAHDLSVHAYAEIPGLAVSFSGAVGPSRVRYAAVTVGFELRWFGM